MPVSKEEICLTYNLTEDECDMIEALALHPTCEHCNKALPPASLEARIGSFECTFCATCVENVMGNVCPNCSGGFAPHPIRPAQNWRNGNDLGDFPARRLMKHKLLNTATHANFPYEIRSLVHKER